MFDLNKKNYICISSYGVQQMYIFSDFTVYNSKNSIRVWGDKMRLQTDGRTDKQTDKLKPPNFRLQGYNKTSLSFTFVKLTIDTK